MAEVKILVSPDVIEGEDFGDEEPEVGNVKIAVSPELVKKVVHQRAMDDFHSRQPSVSINARKTIDGNVMIRDHEDIDIVLMPKMRKVVAFPKESMGDHVYDAQNRLFHHLSKQGVVEPDSITGGNVYNSLEAVIPVPEKDEVSANQLVLFAITKFLEEEAPHYEFLKAKNDQEADLLTDPEAEDSTELGDVPHDQTKGSIVPGLRPYGLMYRIWEGKE